MLVVCLEILGSLSALYFGWIVVLCVGVGLGAAWLGRSKAGGHGREVAAPRVENDRSADRPGGRLLDRRRVDLPDPVEPRLRDVRRRHHLVPHALLGVHRPGTLDRPAPLHRPAAAGRLVLPGQHRARQRGDDRALQERLAGAAAEPDLAADRAAGRLVHRPPLQGRPGDAGRRGDRPRRGGDDRNPARRGAQRHHGARLPARLRRLPDQRPPAAGARRWGGPGRARARRAAARQRTADHGRDRRRPRRLGEDHLPSSGCRDHPWRRHLQRPGPALDHRLGDGAADAGRRRLLVPAGGGQDRRQPDPDHQIRAAQPAETRPDAARPAAALRRHRLHHRRDHLPALVLPRAGERLRAVYGR